MNFVFAALVLALTSLVAPLAEASLNQTQIDNISRGESETKNHKAQGYMFGQGKCVFDPSARTGDRTIAAHGCGLTIPKNAIVTRAVYKVLTTFTSATDAGTIAIKIASANDVVSAVAISTGTTWDASTPVLGIPVTATANTWITTTADSEVTFTVAVEALTAGKLVLFVEWFYFGDS
jgi:hypothetical protein